MFSGRVLNSGSDPGAGGRFLIAIGGQCAQPQRLLPDPRRRRECVSDQCRPNPVTRRQHAEPVASPASDGGRTTPHRDRRARALCDPGGRRRARHPTGENGRRARGQYPRPAASAGHGRTGRRYAGAHHQRLLVVRGRSRPRSPDRARAERGFGQVGGEPSRSLRRHGFGRAAASRAGRRAAR